MKILHILNHSLPEVDGYSMRSQNILIQQKKYGLDVLAVTSPKQGKVTLPVEEIDGIRFYRTSYDEPQRGICALPFLKEGLLIIHLYRRILEIAQKEKVDLIHAHSPSLNGLPAYQAAYQLGVPVVYEMRTLWEEAPADQHRTLFGSLRFVVSKWIETQLLRRVHAISVISQGLKKNLEARGISANKISVFPNGVDLERFIPTNMDEDLKRQLGLEGKFIIGFIGSFFYWEGLDLLIHAAAEIAKQHPEVHFLLVGKDDEDQLKHLARSLQVENSVTFTGKIDPNNILNYYSIIDLFVYPRKSMRLTELVTPLKPLEAMAVGKAVAASNIGGHRELIQHGHTGFLFAPDDVATLAQALSNLIKDSALRRTLAVQGMQWVREERSWGRTMAGYSEIYAKALA